MKKYLSTAIPLLIPIILFAQSVTYEKNLSDSNTFRVMDIQNIASNYMIVSCRDDIGRTIQFLTGSANTVKTISLTLGITMIADFGAKTISPSNDSTIKYRIVKPGFSDQCCSVLKIEHFISMDSIDFVIANKDTPNVVIYFNKKAVTINSPNIVPQIGQPIYQMRFNNKRNAILKPLDTAEINKNIFYSYEFNFMTHEVYSSLHKGSIDTNTISGTTTSLPRLQSVDSGKIETGNIISSAASVDSSKTEVSSIIFGKNMSTGIIHVDVPVNVEYTISIYSLADGKLLFSSNKQQNFSLFPGTYDVEISGMRIKNILVDKGWIHE